MSPGAAGPGLWLLALLVGGPARATRDPQDYRARLHQDAAARAEALNATGRSEEALALCEEQVEAFGEDAAVLYEWAFSLNTQGRLEKAEEVYGRVLALDPRHAAARYDRAELRLARGEVEGAAQDLRVAAEERPDHWAAHFRLAEVAARQGDAAAFEVSLMAALSNGLDLRSLGLDPDWQGFARDPVVGPVLVRILSVYGDATTLDQLRGGGP